MIHIALHFIVPLLIAQVFFRQAPWRAFIIMIATMLVDIDHLLATPIYDPQRCSINFHPFHNQWLIAVYFLACWLPKTRLVGLGLCLHMGLDALDCYKNLGIWSH